MPSIGQIPIARWGTRLLALLTGGRATRTRACGRTRERFELLSRELRMVVQLAEREGGGAGNLDLAALPYHD